MAGHGLLQAVVALGLLRAGFVATPWPDPLAVPWWGIAAAFFVVEATAFHIEIRRETHTISLSAIPLLLGLLSLPPVGLIAARLVGGGLALTLVRRRFGLKLGWNLTLYAMEAAAAVAIASIALNRGPPTSVWAWLVLLGAVLVAELISLVSVPIVIMLAERELRLSLLSQIARSQLLALLSATFATVTAAAMIGRPWMAIFAAIPLTGAALLLRLFGRLGKEHHDLQQLHRFTTTIAGPDSLDDGLAELATILRSSAALLAVPDDHGGYSVRIHRDGTTSDLPVPIATRPPTARLPDRGPVEVAVTDGGPLAEIVGRAGGGRGLAVPVAGHRGGGPAYILVLDRLGTNDRFSPDEIELFGSLAAALGSRLSTDSLLDQLETQARIDGLTGLANRTTLETELERRLDESREGAVLLLDLDRFKDVNDALGHNFGDRLLCLMADRLRALLGDSDLAGRLGGHEFAVIVGRDEATLEALLDRLSQRLDEPFELDGISLEVGSSIGVARFPDDAAIASELLRLADVTMWEAKRTHQPWVRYQPRFDHTGADRLSLIGQIRQAIADDQLRIQLQPQIRTGDLRLVGAEALLRWHHPERGLIPPNEFVPLVEQSSLSGALTHHVIAQAMRAVATLAAAGHDLRISVNLTARDLLDRSLPPTVAAMLSASGIAPHCLGFEVTESSLIIDFESAVANLHALRTLGCRTSVDDFGTGYASLQYLQRLPIDEVKIDRSFVAGATTNSDSESIVRSTTRLLHDLHLQVVAEGVEDQPTLDLLRTIGCDLAQGFLFAKAMPVEEFVRWTDDYIMPRRATSRWETSTNSPVRIS